MAGEEIDSLIETVTAARRTTPRPPSEDELRDRLYGTMMDLTRIYPVGTVLSQAMLWNGFLAFLQSVLGSAGQPEFVWCAQEGIWLYFNGTFWQAAAEEEIQKYGNLWLEINGQAPTKAKKYAEMVKPKRLVYSEFFNPPGGFLNTRSGILILADKILVPHRDIPPLQVPFRYCLRFDWKPEPRETPHWDRLRAVYPRELLRLEIFLRSMLMGETGARMVCWVFGPPGSGKSAALRPWVNILIDACATLAIHDISDNSTKFSIQPLMGTRLNVDIDARRSDLPSEAVSTVKKILDGLPVMMNPKGVRAFPYTLSPYHLIVVTNTLPGLHTDEDRKSILKRAWLVEFDRVQKKDSAFEAGLLAEMDDYISELIQTPLPSLEECTRDSEAVAREAAAAWEKSQFWWRGAIRDLLVKTGNAADWVKNADLAVQVGRWAMMKSRFKADDMPDLMYIQRELSLAMMHVFQIESEKGETSRDGKGYRGVAYRPAVLAAVQRYMEERHLIEPGPLPEVPICPESVEVDFKLEQELYQHKLALQREHLELNAREVGFLLDRIGTREEADRFASDVLYREELLLRDEEARELREEKD